jgi:hypothetical protein
LPKLALARAPVAALVAAAALLAATPRALAASPAAASPSAPAPTAAAPADSQWSAPATLGACAALGAPRAAFPRDEPKHATGRGAVVWAATRDCPDGAGTLVAPLGAGDVPQSPRYARAADGMRLQLRPPLALAPAPHGEIAIAGSSSTPSARDGELVQGGAGGPFTPLGALAGDATDGSLFSAYLGDIAAVSPTGGPALRGGVRVDVERYFAHALSPPRIVPSRAGAVEDPTVSLDYRTDAIVVWRQAGALLARELPGRGGARPTQRLANVGAHVAITALTSDDDRSIVAWADRQAGHTSIYLDVSGARDRFGAPRMLERFADPASLPAPAGSPRLVRLSSESVMLAWTGALERHLVVRTAAIDLNGIGSPNTLSDARADALLDDIATGPDGDAFVLWSVPTRSTSGSLDTRGQALFAARGFDADSNKTAFGESEEVAASGANEDATIAVDPASDRALALWRTRAGAIEYAVRTAARR